MMTLALTPRQWPKLSAGGKQSSDVVRLQQCGISVAIQDPFCHVWIEAVGVHSGIGKAPSFFMHRSLWFLVFL